LEGIIADLESHDPDVIFIEEATASRPFLAAWRAAMRRRVVVAGISCSGLAGAFDYLISERHFNHSLMAGIKGIVSCNGVRTLCPHCRDSSPSDCRDSGIHSDGIYYRGKGCAVCGYSGLNGMKYLLDVIHVDSRLRETFDSARDCSELLKYLSGIGHGNLEEQLVNLLRKGEISPEEYTAAGIQF
jgi:type II secretory ATPase GspE/PulE/Tfp pilus assembly ATPase PilB-like protein